jgi:hypothetical protein
MPTSTESVQPTTGWDDLLREAEARLVAQEERDLGELGEAVEFTQEEPHFMGRYRGVGQLETKRGVVGVYLFWDRHGERRFAYQHLQLVAEMTELNPRVGDKIVIVRGRARSFQKNGETRTVYPYTVRCCVSADPLPEERPFLWPAERVTRSVSPAAGATV